MHLNVDFLFRHILGLLLLFLGLDLTGKSQFPFFSSKGCFKFFYRLRQTQTNLVESSNKQIDNFVRRLQMDSSRMYEQREIKVYLISLYFASTLYIKFFSLTLKVNSEHCKLRGLLFFSSLSTQLIQELLFTSFFFF